MKYKKLSIVFLLIVLLFVFPTISKATITVEYNGETVELPDLPFDPLKTDIHYLITHNRYGYHIYYNEDPNFYRFRYSYSDLTSDMAVYAVNENDELLSNSRLMDLQGDKWTASKEWDKLGTDVSILKGNENVYNDDGTIFFRPAPVGKLGEIVEKTPIQETLLQIVKILPLILVVVVSFLGLRKCWRLLSMLLHQA